MSRYHITINYRREWVGGKEANSMSYHKELDKQQATWSLGHFNDSKEVLVLVPRIHTRHPKHTKCHTLNFTVTSWALLMQLRLSEWLSEPLTDWLTDWLTNTNTHLSQWAKERARPFPDPPGMMPIGNWMASSQSGRANRPLYTCSRKYIGEMALSFFNQLYNDKEGNGREKIKLRQWIQDNDRMYTVVQCRLVSVCDSTVMDVFLACYIHTLHVMPNHLAEAFLFNTYRSAETAYMNLTFLLSTAL